MNDMVVCRPSEGPNSHHTMLQVGHGPERPPFVGTKLVAGYFGGTRVPMAISWPAKIVADKAVRNQFHHVNDIASTIYDVVKLKPQETLNGVKQLPLDGVSMAYTFANASAADQKGPQYFEFAGSRAQYSNGWIASVFGPRKPWSDDIAGLLSWSGKAAFITRSPWIGNTLVG
jgi:arylsulfatase A-like enzyme